MSSDESDFAPEQEVTMPKCEGEKKPRKKMEVSEKKRAASIANAAKAREARARKKAEREQQKSEEALIYQELIAERKAQKAASKSVNPPEKSSTPQIFGSSDDSDESDDDSSSDDELIITRKKATKVAQSAHASALDTSLLQKLQKLEAKYKKLKQSQKGGFNVIFNQPEPKMNPEVKKALLDI